jgi:hypothetical protein
LEKIKQVDQDSQEGCLDNLIMLFGGDECADMEDLFSLVRGSVMYHYMLTQEETEEPNLKLQARRYQTIEYWYEEFISNYQEFCQVYMFQCDFCDWIDLPHEDDGDSYSGPMLFTKEALVVHRKLDAYGDWMYYGNGKKPAEWEPSYTQDHLQGPTYWQYGEDQEKVFQASQKGNSSISGAWVFQSTEVDRFESSNDLQKYADAAHATESIQNFSTPQKQPWLPPASP